MPRQTAARGRKKSGGGRGGGRAGGNRKIITPAPDESDEEPTPSLIVCLKLYPADLQAFGDAAAVRAPAPDVGVGGEIEDGAEELPVVTTRSGRTVKQKQDDDYVWGDDLSSQLASSPLKKASDSGGDSAYQYRGRGSTSTRK